MPGVDRLESVTEAMDGLWRRLDAARAARAVPAAADRMREALGVLAQRLAARHTGNRPSGDIDRGADPHSPPIRLPDLEAPDLSVVLRAGSGLATLRRLTALAPAADVAGAEFIVVDPGHDPYTALLPGQVRNLRYLRDGRATTTAAAGNLVVSMARGARMLLLDDGPAVPSAASLFALARAAARAAPALLLGSAATAALERAGERQPPEIIRLRGRLGVALCVDRGLWSELGPLDTALHDGAALECADLAFRARLLGLPVLAVGEPAAADPATALPSLLVAPADVRRALATFSERWGAAALDPTHRPA
jgi:hypothetical protein